MLRNCVAARAAIEVEITHVRIICQLGVDDNDC